MIEAEMLWVRVRPIIQEELENKAERLREQVERRDEHIRNLCSRLEGFV